MRLTLNISLRTYTHNTCKVPQYQIYHSKINQKVFTFSRYSCKKWRQDILQKKTCTLFVIDNQIKMFLEIQYTTRSNENTINTNKKAYFKLPYIGTIFSNATKIKLKQICDKYCWNISHPKISSILCCLPIYLFWCHWLWSFSFWVQLKEVIHRTRKKQILN